MAKRTYNPSVRVGNWCEDIHLEEGILKDFIAKKEKGELLIQRIQNILDTILKQTELTASTDGFVHMGDKIMVVNPGQDVNNVPLHQLDHARLPHSLAMNADESMLFYDRCIKAPCEISASRVLNPCKRNTFVITSVDGTALGETLCFGQPFTLSTLPGYTADLKLWSDHVRFNQRARKSKLQIANFIKEMNYMCVWKVLSHEPLQRLETEGLPVPANAKVVIHHCKTGEKLGMVDKYKVNTPFGREYEVVAYTKLDSHNSEVDQNHWVLVTANPEDTKKTMLDRVLKSITEDDQFSDEEKEENERKHWEREPPQSSEPGGCPKPKLKN